jgi:YD repeat-containing protein
MRPTRADHESGRQEPAEAIPEERTRTVVLDAQGRVAATQVTGLAPVTFGRDATGLLRTITDPLPRATTFGYDDADRVTSQEFPDEEVVLPMTNVASRLASPPVRRMMGTISRRQTARSTLQVIP